MMTKRRRRRKMSPPLKPRGSNQRRRRWSITRWNSLEMICTDLQQQRSLTSWKRLKLCSTAASSKCRWDCCDWKLKSNAPAKYNKPQIKGCLLSKNRWMSCWKRLSLLSAGNSKSVPSFRWSPICSRMCRCHQKLKCVVLWRASNTWQLDKKKSNLFNDFYSCSTVLSCVLR